MVSAGNTGATMASALLRMGRIRGVSRPAIATPLPVPGHAPNILLDAGANSEVQAEWLVQFAQMGTIFARLRFGVEAPRVGLLSIGEEAGKGDSLRKEAFDLLSGAPGIEFAGNVEGRDTLVKTVDVIVTDGFTGNVVLKTLEGGTRMLINEIKRTITANAELRAHADALAPVLDPLWEAMSPDTYGGAMLLGVDGVCIISHGSTDRFAMLNAIRVAGEMVDHDVVGALRAAIVGQP
jgi:glycerol-3-phosphate acyltransferase PlsX